MKNRGRTPIFLAAFSATALLALGGCATAANFGATVEAEATADFAQFKTYAFPADPVGDRSSIAYSPQMVGRLQATFARHLEAEGLRRVFDERAADLVVSYGVTVRSGTEVRVVPMAWSRAHDTNVRLESMDEHGMHDSSYDEVRVSERTAGMLVLELWDARGGRVAWRAWISGELHEDRNDNFAGLERALLEAFEKYPPPPKR